MIRMRLRSLHIQTAITLLLPPLFFGCFFDLSEKEDFPSWYYGDPGLAGALGETDCDRYADHIQERRHPYYLHFRTPEVILQPQGGAHYPARTTAERRAGRKDATPPACEKVGRGWETFRFDAVDAGVVDMVVPYRKPFADSDYRTQPARRNLTYARGVVYNTGLAAVMKAPVYIVHDILKTLYIPVAGAYYLLQSEAPREPSDEIDAIEGASATDVSRPAVSSASPDASGAAGREPTPPTLPAAETMGDGDQAADDDAAIRIEAEEEEESAAAPEATTPEAAAGEGHAVVQPVADEPDTADDMADVPAAEAPPALEPIPWVRLAKRKLRKQVAFIGLFSRAANVGEEIKAYLQDRLWPVFEEQCEDTLTLIRPGDADFPTALNTLMRGPYGHLNSFELITVARFNGLNAIVSGTIIDIRVAKELGGILWYKTPEGQLRITILVEVYDAETGTKLLDRIYIREEEVAELEPGADEKPRNEDQAVLDKALQSIAEDMGEDVCDVLEDQPWRVFVAGIDGKRITLSAGENVGLQAGNILRVHNSQIIDGMNNQQFFLTGEKVGRIQIINLFANHSEALLIEGQGLRDYSVVIPE
jgi:hypothetical protein